jgi:hypothetical protein
MPKQFDASRVMGAAFGERMTLVHMLLSQIMDRHVTHAELGELLAEAEGKDTPYSASTVSRWESGTHPSEPATILAICSLVKGKVDPGWLSYGDASKAPGLSTRNFTLTDIMAARAGGRRKPR